MTSPGLEAVLAAGTRTKPSRREHGDREHGDGALEEGRQHLLANSSGIPCSSCSVPKYTPTPDQTTSTSRETKGMTRRAREWNRLSPTTETPRHREISSAIPGSDFVSFLRVSVPLWLVFWQPVRVAFGEHGDEKPSPNFRPFVMRSDCG